MNVCEALAESAVQTGKSCVGLPAPIRRVPHAVARPAAGERPTKRRRSAAARSAGLRAANLRHVKLRAANWVLI